MHGDQLIVRYSDMMNYCAWLCFVLSIHLSGNSLFLPCWYCVVHMQNRHKIKFILPYLMILYHEFRHPSESAWVLPPSRYWRSAGTALNKEKTWCLSFENCCLTHLPWTKWPPFRRWHFQVHFNEWKVVFWFKFHFVPRGPIDNNSALVQIMACRLRVRHQTIIWTNADAVYWRIYAAPGEEELCAEIVFMCSVNRYLRSLGTTSVEIRYSLAIVIQGGADKATGFRGEWNLRISWAINCREILRLRLTEATGWHIKKSSCLIDIYLCSLCHTERWDY